MQSYILKLYDEPLLTFSYVDNSFDGEPIKLLGITSDRREFLPLDLELSGSGILRWIEKRIIPKNRAFVQQILLSLGLSPNRTKGILNVCKALSLNDSYWIVPEGFTGSYKEYNLYENPFSEILSLVAYTGYTQSDHAFSTSPELTTDGTLPKAWRKLEDGIYLYKGGSSGAANTGNEPYSEFYASQIAKAMGLHSVEYGLKRWKDILASTCPLFTDIDTSFIPIGRLVKSGGLNACLEYMRGISDEAYQEVCSMLVFDAVICNEDRHFGNFGVLRNNKTGKLLGAAPIFDNGLSLFNFAYGNELDDLDGYAKTRAPRAADSFEELVSAFGGTTQASQLRKLINFRFTRHPLYNLPESRLEAIERHIQRKLPQLIKLCTARQHERMPPRPKRGGKDTR